MISGVHTGQWDCVFFWFFFKFSILAFILGTFISFHLFVLKKLLRVNKIRPVFLIIRDVYNYFVVFYTAFLIKYISKMSYKYWFFERRSTELKKYLF